jgi:hypothetical protein
MVFAYVAILTGAALIAFGAGLALAGLGGAIARGSRPVARPRHSRTSIQPRRPATLDDYGLLRAVVLVENLDTGRSVRDLLGAAGVRATIATGSDGITRVLVFPHEYDQARRMVSWVL